MVGQEIHDAAYADEDGTLRPITREEQLAREIWKRALGWEEEVPTTNGQSTHRVHAPDAKAQEFIFERLEGRATILQDESSTALVDKISEVVRAKMNEDAKQAVDNDRNDT